MPEHGNDELRPLESRFRASASGRSPSPVRFRAALRLLLILSLALVARFPVQAGDV